MTLLVIGVTHRSAPLDVLDDIAVDPIGARRLAVDAMNSRCVSEAMVLATCNRLEVWADVTAFHASSQELSDLLAAAVGADKSVLQPHLLVRYGGQATRHLFDVAAGLDSLVVGEQQILGQVRDCLTRGQELGTVGRRLNSATQAALRAAKRVHSQTGISRHGASLVSVGLGQVERRMAGRIQDAAVVVVGAGSMAALAVSTLHQAGARDLTVANRTASRANSLVAGTTAGAASLADLPALAARADVIVSCTGSTDLIIRAQDVAGRAAGAPLIVLDLAMPHDTDPALAQQPGVTRIALADLALDARGAATDKDIAAAHAILEEELARHLTHESQRRLDPLVVSLRAQAEEQVTVEAGRIRARLPHLSPTDLDEIENSLRRTVNALLHTPTVRVKQWAVEPDGRRYADAIHALFDLPAATIEALGAPEGDPEEASW